MTHTKNELTPATLENMPIGHTIKRILSRF